ncbi:cupredoxin domain-containing protein [Pseudooceanicola nanhaiensis]|uniref:cupredoxin domain-containing protein n=1 Tax=Pseudooceanicola nanhaiensis TaxID=375761 RepID=UPI0040595BD5
MLGKNLFAAVLCGLFLSVAAAPAQAALQWDWGCRCWRDTGSGSGDGTTGSYTASNGAKYSILKETVAYSGRTHLVLVNEEGFFPERIYANKGDRVLFVNKSDRSLTVEATNTSWNSQTLYRGSSYLLLVQDGLHGRFRDKASCGWNSCTRMAGEIRIAALPAEVNFWEDTLAITEMLPMFGIATSALTSSVTFVGNLQTANGFEKSVTGV